MALTYSWPGPTALATTTDGRKAMSGLVVKSAAGVPRAGVFPRHANALVSSRVDMNIDIGIFEAAAFQFGGVVLFTNDATANLPSVLVSPGAGTNYYVVYAKQNESTAPGTDANNNRVLGTVLSTSSFATARASGTRMDASGSGLPSGAVELATVEMPTGKTATNQGGVVITQTFQYTAAAGGTVWLRNQTEEDAWLPADGASGFRVDTARHLVRRGSAWRLVPLGSLLSEWHINVPAASAGGQPLGPAAAPTLVIPAVAYARTIRVTVQGGVFLSSAGDGGVSVVPSTGAWAGATNSHRVAGTTAVFSDLSYVFYMTSLPASTALTLTLSSASSVNAGYDLHFRVEEA